MWQHSRHYRHGNASSRHEHRRALQPLTCTAVCAHHCLPEHHCMSVHWPPTSEDPLPTRLMNRGGRGARTCSGKDSRSNVLVWRLLGCELHQVSSFHFLHKPNVVRTLELNWSCSGLVIPIRPEATLGFSSVGCGRAHLGLALLSLLDGGGRELPRLCDFTSITWCCGVPWRMWRWDVTFTGQKEADKVLIPVPGEENTGYESPSGIRLWPNHTWPFHCLGAPVEMDQKMGISQRSGLWIVLATAGVLSPVEKKPETNI